MFILCSGDEHMFLKPLTSVKRAWIRAFVPIRQPLPSSIRIVVRGLVAKVCAESCSIFIVPSHLCESRRTKANESDKNTQNAPEFDEIKEFSLLMAILFEFVDFGCISSTFQFRIRTPITQTPKFSVTSHEKGNPPLHCCAVSEWRKVRLTNSKNLKISMVIVIPVGLCSSSLSSVTNLKIILKVPIEDPGIDDFSHS